MRSEQLWKMGIITVDKNGAKFFLAEGQTVKVEIQSIGLTIECQ